MAFSLPVRVATPPSLVLDPIFSLLYEDNEASLAHFIDNKAPLPLNGVINDPRVMEYLLTREPGPKVEYKNLRPALAALRPFLSASPHGRKLMAFYKQLLQLQGRWAIAAAEMATFDLYVKFYQVLFIDHGDKKLVDHVVKMVPDAAYKIATYTTGNRDQFTTMAKAEKQRLVKNTRAAAQKLFDFKASKGFFQQHGKLVAAIERSEKQLKACREKAVRRRREAVERRAAALAAAQGHNEATLTRQMGMAGMTPHVPQVENSVVDWTQEVSSACFAVEAEPGQP
ncbi:hypothetical protein A1O3_10434 [Capronia epimyces CBS 606.96]|uniref:Uncharacterized protein n=1 Tax=Capronia epimyces CBS 606.96 TaxID=1182542 RepID=W9XJY4_9EURO|nr:uncharacterized protein A1O3_10434 [Capronia epimyces CBS 606.96]EXJ77276.1 hypothetical protein A1O3_10434 [Capronia epimyces CBS 606.96]